MAPLWMSPILLYLLLVLLCETTAQEPTNPPSAPTVAVNPRPVDSSNGNTPTNGSAGASSETQTDRVTFPVIQTTVAHNTTMDILSIMSERDSLQEESQRLRKAVIVLAVFFTLATTAIIIVAAWYFMKRRKSTKLSSGNRAQKTTSAEVKRGTLPQKTQNTDSSDIQNTDQKTDKTVHQQGKELRNSLSTSASSTSGDYEVQSNSPDNSQHPTVARKTNKVVYANTGANQTQPSDGAELDPQDVYIDLDKGNSRDSVDATIATKSSEPEQQTRKDDVYENVTPDALKTYSALDTESQYEHHYDKL